LPGNDFEKKIETDIRIGYRLAELTADVALRTAAAGSTPLEGLTVATKHADPS